MALTALARMIACLPVAAILAEDTATVETVRRIAETQAALPWVWSPSMEGMGDIPYAYESQRSRRILDRHGREVPPSQDADAFSRWRSLHLERIALDWGSHFRCLSNDGHSPCSPAWIAEFERQAGKRTSLTPADRDRIDAVRRQRRERCRAFWTAFPGAMQFALRGPGEIRFKPAGRNPGFALQGSLLFDPATYRIVSMEYEALRDIEDPLIRLTKGDRFTIGLTLADGYSLPAQTRVRRHLPKDGLIEDVRTGYLNFRRFASDSQVRFVDPP